MVEIMSHSSEALIIASNLAVAHVTWRLLPAKARHNVRRLACWVTRRPAPVIRKSIHHIGL